MLTNSKFEFFFEEISKLNKIYDLFKFEKFENWKKSKFESKSEQNLIWTNFKIKQNCLDLKIKSEVK
jgi:hypothetical protein